MMSIAWAWVGEDDASDEIITVPYIQELHLLITANLLARPCLSGKDSRFLRSELGWTPLQ